MASPRSWLVLAVGSERQRAGNDGYDDKPETYYSWDSTVPNHSKVQPGDRIVLWDKRFVIGVSVVEEIKRDKKTKALYRCPNCKRSDIEKRKKKTPRIRCRSCKFEFDKPVVKYESVETYESRHDAAWVGLEGQLTGGKLRDLCVSPASQLSLRPLRWLEFCEALGDSAGLEVRDQVEQLVESRSSGHRKVTTRARIGQGVFRQDLLSRYSSVCALTGPAPVAALEAAHLYSYAKIGKHYAHGGLLLRRDVHCLFDRGDIAVDPETRRVHVRPELKNFPSYYQLNGARLQIKGGVTDLQFDWLKKHWEQHR